MSASLSIQRLEQLCEVLYRSSNQNERKEAEVRACDKADPVALMTYCLDELGVLRRSC